MRSCSAVPTSTSDRSPATLVGQSQIDVLALTEEFRLRLGEFGVPTSEIDALLHDVPCDNARPLTDQATSLRVLVEGLREAEYGADVREQVRTLLAQHLGPLGPGAYQH